MQDYILTVELSMSNIPNSEDFKNCIQYAFVNYCKKHSEEKVVLKYMHLKVAEQTLCHQDAFGNWYLPNVGKNAPIKKYLKDGDS